jgi:6-phosphogluconolactonase (cycloisomerase 2 family)
VLVSADGRFVYASNRGHDSIAVFARNADTGALTPAAVEPLPYPQAVCVLPAAPAA